MIKMLLVPLNFIFLAPASIITYYMQPTRSNWLKSTRNGKMMPGVGVDLAMQLIALYWILYSILIATLDRETQVNIRLTLESQLTRSGIWAPPFPDIV